MSPSNFRPIADAQANLDESLLDEYVILHVLRLLPMTSQKQHLYYQCKFNGSDEPYVRFNIANSMYSERLLKVFIKMRKRGEFKKERQNG